jgi:hypothetical protein
MTRPPQAYFNATRSHTVDELEIAVMEMAAGVIFKA